MILNLIALISLGLQTAPLVATPPIVIPGGAGHFDFMGIDGRNQLVLACHPGKSSLAVLDIASGKATDVPVGTEVNGVAADGANHRVYAAGPGKTLVALDSTTWAKVGTLALDGPGDCVQFDRARGVLYVDNDDGTNLWIVNAETLKLVASITIKEAPEYMEYDAGKSLIFQAIKSTSTVQVIDAAARKVDREYALGTLTSPHGLALDRKTRRLFVAGKNGKLVILDADNGKLLNTVDVVPNSDQIAYDPSNQRVYIPSGGELQVVQIDGDGGKVLGSVPVGKDCKRVAVDRRSHDVYVAFSEGAESYFQKFTVQ
jgi:DNA-binding beta-propeller fold protein YncE